MAQDASISKWLHEDHVRPPCAGSVLFTVNPTTSVLRLRTPFRDPMVSCVFPQFPALQSHPTQLVCLPCVNSNGYDAIPTERVPLAWGFEGTFELSLICQHISMCSVVHLRDPAKYCCQSWVSLSNGGELSCYVSYTFPIALCQRGRGIDAVNSARICSW